MIQALSVPFILAAARASDTLSEVIRVLHVGDRQGVAVTFYIFAHETC